MKNFKKVTIIFCVFIMIIFISIYSLSNSSNLLTEHYQFKLLFEKNLSNPIENNDIILFGNASQNFILDGPSPFGPTSGQWYHVPPILYVDNFENIYILIPGRIEVFDMSGNSLLKFYIPDDSLKLDYYSWNEKCLYLFFKKHYFDLDYQIFEMNLLQSKTSKLNNNDLKLLESNLLPPTKKKEMSQTKAYLKSISNKDGIYYGIGWGKIDMKLLGRNNDDQRYIDPIEILVLKFDRSYNELYSGPISEDVILTYPDIYDKFKFDKINIQKLFEDKVVCIGMRNSYVDKKGNIFLTGIKSNDVNRIKINETNIYNSMEVKNPIFFLAKLENN